MKKKLSNTASILEQSERHKICLGKYLYLYLETTHHKPAELEDHMKIASVTMRIVFIIIIILIIRRGNHTNLAIYIQVTALWQLLKTT